jgi:hypothetical protein
MTIEQYDTAHFIQYLSDIWYLAEGVYRDGMRRWEELELFDRETLLNWLYKWDIEDFSSFSLQSSWLLDQGYRADYEQYSAKLVTFPYAQRVTYLENSELVEQEQEKLRIILQYQNILSSSGILAYDYMTYIGLQYIGNVLGFLSKNERQSNVIAAAKTLQSKYTNWGDCMIACIAGALFQGSADYYPNYQISKKEYMEVLHTLHDLHE